MTDDARPEPTSGTASTQIDSGGTMTAPGRPSAVAATRSLRTVEPELYDVGAEIAHGGMGRIRAAVDLRLGREVAIKELLEHDSEGALRFEREALVTARLQHPGIVAVYEAGRWPSGEPFYAMKRVHGRSFKKVIAETERFDARLALLPHVAAVADAMAYAHDQRIVHRDLKPANVLVGEFGETVVIDWGLAKDLAAADEPASRASRSSSAELTRAGSIMGTPQYMPPEQARGEALDERADVYAIGAMLYHVLAGAPPYDGESSDQVLAKVVAEPPVPLASRMRGLAPDLLAIVARAMARDRAGRYPTARELADDLRRFQTGQLVASHRYTRGELVRRFMRRHRMPLAIAGVAALVLAGGGVLSVQRIRDQRDQARSERRRADELRALADKERDTAAERADALAIEQAASKVESDPRGVLIALEQLSKGTKQLAAARVLAADAEARRIPHPVPLRATDITSIDLSHDGRRLAYTSGDRAVRTLDLDDADARPRELGSFDARAQRIAISRDGGTVVASAFDETVRVWQLATGRTTQIVAAKHVFELNVANDGAVVLIATTDGRLRLYDAATAKIVFDAPGGRGSIFSADGRSLAYLADDDVHVVELAGFHDRVIRVGKHTAFGIDADGKRAAIARADHSLATLDLASGVVHELGNAGPAPITSLALSPDATTVYTLAGTGELRAWPSTGGPPRTIGSQPIASPASSWLAAGPGALLSLAKGANLWDLDTFDAVELVPPPHVGLTDEMLAPDGSRAIAVAGDTLWMWSTRGNERAAARLTGGVHQVAYLPDGRVLASSDDALVVGAETIALQAKLVGRAAITADAARAAMLGSDGVVRVIDLHSRDVRALDGKLAATPREAPADARLTKIVHNKDGSIDQSYVMRRGTRQRRDQAGWTEPVVFSRDGALVAAAGTTGGTVRLWTVADGRARTFDVGDTDVEQLAFTRDGGTLIAAAGDGRIHLFPVGGGGERLLSSPDPIEAIAISPDGKTLASGGVDHVLRFWDLATGAMRVRKVYADVVTAIAFSPDGRWIASAVQDRTIWLENLAEDRSVLVDGYDDVPLALAFSADSSELVSSDDAGRVRVFDLRAARGRSLRVRGASIGDVAVSPDGRSVLAAGADGIAREWTDDVPADEAGLRAYMARLR